MFHIGDKVFYPLHGGGIISAIEQKEFLGKTRNYYVLELLQKKMVIMVPVGTKSTMQLRQIVSKSELTTLLDAFYDKESDLTIPFKQRPKRNMEKIKSGNITQIAEVIRDLVRIDRQKKLCSSEQNMLCSTIQLLASEVSLVNQISTEEAADLVSSVIEVQE